MFGTQIKTAIRNIIKNKLFSFINIAGLAIGISISLLIIGLISNDLAQEDCHENANLIYRVAGSYTYPDHDAVVYSANIMPALGPVMRESLTDINKVVRFRNQNNATFHFDAGQTFSAQNTFIAEPEFLEIFTLPLKMGDKKTALTAPYSIIISEEVCQSLFPNDNPLGQTISDNDDNKYQITGVFAHIPHNTQLRSNVVISYSTLESQDKSTTSWTNFGMDYTYIKINKNAIPAKIENDIAALLVQNLGNEEAEAYDLKLQSLKSIYFDSHLGSELEPIGNLEQLYLFSGIAVILLIIACINFVNITSAQTINRIKEVGIRKVLGATKKHLIIQNLMETMIITVIATAAGMVLYEVFLPGLEAFIGRKLEINMYTDPFLLFSIFSMILSIGVFVGVYPALLFSRFHPSSLIQNGLMLGSSRSLPRRIMVSVQFIIAIVLIAVTFGVFKQIDYSLTNVGFETENIMTLDISGLPIKKQKLLKSKIMKNSSAIMSTISSMVPGESSFHLYNVKTENSKATDNSFFNGVRIDSDYTSVFGLNLVSGNSISSDELDNPREIAFVNKTGIDQLGIDASVDNSLIANNSIYDIGGVLSDFHQLPFRNNIPAMLFVVSPENCYYLSVKLHSENINQSIAAIENIWNNMIPNVPFNYQFLDDLIRSNYGDDEKLGFLVLAFSGINIFIACLGLFGLTEFYIGRKQKEIGIRKILGASTFRIVRLLFKEYIYIAITSTLAAWPFAYILFQRWIENFAYHINFGWEIIVLSGGCVLTLAILSVFSRALKAATANPVDAIKYE